MRLPDGRIARVYHQRMYEIYRLEDGKGMTQARDVKPSPRGGQTVVEVFDASGNVFVGIARCNDRDNYCKKLGREIALGRALKAQEDREKQIVSKQQAQQIARSVAASLKEISQNAGGG